MPEIDAKNYWKKRAADYEIKLSQLSTFIKNNPILLSTIQGDYERKMRELGFLKTVQDVEHPSIEDSPADWAVRAVAEFQHDSDLTDVSEIVYQWHPATKSQKARVLAYYKEKKEL